MSFHESSSWTEERKEKYYSDFFEILGNAKKLKTLSVYLDQTSMRKFYVNWINPSVNNQHQCLEEFRIYFKLSELEHYTNFLEYGVFQVLDQCPKYASHLFANIVCSPLKMIICCSETN